MNRPNENCIIISDTTKQEIKEVKTTDDLTKSFVSVKQEVPQQIPPKYLQENLKINCESSGAFPHLNQESSASESVA